MWSHTDYILYSKYLLRFIIDNSVISYTVAPNPVLRGPLSKTSLLLVLVVSLPSSWSLNSSNDFYLFIHTNQICQIREPSKTCRMMGLEDKGWEPLVLRMDRCGQYKEHWV